MTSIGNSVPYRMFEDGETLHPLSPILPMKNFRETSSLIPKDVVLDLFLFSFFSFLKGPAVTFKQSFGHNSGPFSRISTGLGPFAHILNLHTCPAL